MGHGDAYDASLADYDREHPDAATIDRHEHLAIEDSNVAADTLRPVYDRLDSKDGYGQPGGDALHRRHRRDDRRGAEAVEAVGKPNLMIKIPGTLAGGPAISATIAAGINVNVTLLFAQSAYQRVAEAYATGLEERVRQGQPIDRIASVASFFVSRIDSAIDKKNDEAGSEDAKALRGKVAVANAKLAYAWYQDFTASDRWQALAAKGAQPQRLLWASTGTKDPAYPDTLYIDTLIGPDTVNTMPPKTMDAFRDHGVVAETLTADVDDARLVSPKPSGSGSTWDGVTDRLVEEGVASFAKASTTSSARSRRSSRRLFEFSYFVTPALCRGPEFRKRCSLSLLGFACRSLDPGTSPG